MSSTDWWKNFEDSIKNGLIIVATTTRIFFTVKKEKVSPSKAYLYAVGIMRLDGGI